MPPSAPRSTKRWRAAAPERLFDQGDFDAAVGSARALGATYRIAAGFASLARAAGRHGAADGRRLEVWAPVQDYDAAHRAAADAAGLKRGEVVLYPMPVGDGGGRRHAR